MKKKFFFKFFLFTVIASLVTFTACKDYDDDIDDLQNQITNLSGVKTDLDGVKADIAAARSSANDALAKANEALETAKKAGDADAIAKAQTAADAAKAKADEVEAEAERLLGLIEALEGRVDDLEALDSPSKQDLENLKDEVALIQEDAAAITSKMIASVTLLDNYKDLTFNTITEKKNVFVDGLPGAITFTEGKQVQIGDYFIIQVSPADAVVTHDMITIQNSKGEVYDNLEVEVERNNELITRATTANSGLWKVSVKLKEYDKKSFEAATTSEKGRVAFAVAVGEDERTVLSAYDLTLNYSGDYKPLKSLDFTVGGKERTKLYPAVLGKAFKIALTGENVSDKVRGMYVTLDDKGATTEELNSWKTYDYSNLDKVFQGTEVDITINRDKPIKDEITFRVHAVNHDGTLVDKDGKTFTVRLGEEAEDWNAYNTVVTATEEGKTVIDAESAKVDVELTKLTGAATYEWTTDKSEVVEGTPAKSPAFTLHMVRSDVDAHLNFTSDGDVNPAIDFSKVTKVYTKPTVDSWLAYKDNKEYKGTLTIKNATGHVLATLNVTFKKELPKAAPKGFSIKDKQVVNGILNAYMLPENWDGDVALQGTLKLAEIFNLPEGFDKFETTFAASQKDGDKTIAVLVENGGKLTVAKSFIDNKTEHATEVVYNYGKISTEKKDGDDVVDYKAPVVKFKTIYNNIYNSYTWKWATREQLIKMFGKDSSYGQDDGKGNYINALPTNEVTYGKNTTFDLNWIYGTSSYDPKYHSGFGTPYSFDDGKMMYKITKVKLVSKASGVEEYFTTSEVNEWGKVTFTKVADGTSNPTGDVPSTLVVEFTDMFGVKRTFEYDMVVKRSE